MSKLSIIFILIFFTMISILYLIILNNVHPIFLIILMLIYTLMICINMSTWSYNYIYSIMMFFIIVSGLLIIFLYFASLISNEQNKINWYPIISINMLLNFIFSIFLVYFSNKVSLSYPLYLSLESSPLTTLNNNAFNNVIKIFFYPSNNLTLMSMFYLLFALFMIIKICSSKSSPLRKIS